MRSLLTGLLQLAIITIVMLTGSQSIGQPVILEVGFPEFYPLSYTGESGKPEGILIDIIETVAPEAGYDVRATSYPGKRLFANLEKGRVHVWMGIAQWAPKETTIVGTTPLTHIELRVYHLNAPPVLAKEQLQGQSVVILLGYSYGGWRDYIMKPDSGILFYETDDREAAFKMLKMNRVDYYMDYKRPSLKSMKTIQVPGIRHTVISSLDCFFVVSKKVPQAELVLARLEAAYKRLVTAGRINPDL